MGSYHFGYQQSKQSPQAETAERNLVPVSSEGDYTGAQLDGCALLEVDKPD